VLDNSGYNTFDWYEAKYKAETWAVPQPPNDPWPFQGTYGELASLETVAEWQWVTSTFDNDLLPYVWIGGYTEAEGGEYKWLSGEPWVDEQIQQMWDWDDWPPTTAVQSRAVAFYGGANPDKLGLLHQYFPTEKFGGEDSHGLLVEFTPTPVPIPEPCTLLLLGSASLFGAAFRKRFRK
jgi:hypothetical protein